MAPIIVALDFPTAQQALDFTDKFAENKQELFVKVGMELFYNAGWSIIDKLRQQNHKIFLDLKLHDIPNTVQQAAYQLGQHELELVTIHASGGSKMIKAAKQGLQEGARVAGVQPPKLLAITQLTSTSAQQLQEEQNITIPLEEEVTKLATLAYSNGADGVVASALENPAIHQATANDFLCINPGIRLAENDKNDQQRITSPTKAKELGSNGIVVGRPITQAVDPVAAYQNILRMWT